MNEHDNLPGTETAQAPQNQVDETRRRFSRGGAAGAGVLLAVASRSAFGTSTWGTCTGSELASGNLSREGTPRPCGCSPGYWKSSNQNGQELWGNVDIFTPYLKGASFNDTFGRNFFASSSTTLQAAVDKTGGALGSWCPASKVGNMQNVAFHAVAALLNAHFYGTRYPVTGLQSATALISAFKTAFDGGTTSLTTFMTKVDIYGSTSNLWCDGSPE